MVVATVLLSGSDLVCCKSGSWDLPGTSTLTAQRKSSVEPCQRISAAEMMISRPNPSRGPAVRMVMFRSAFRGRGSTTAQPLGLKQSGGGHMTIGFSAFFSRAAHAPNSNEMTTTFREKGKFPWKQYLLGHGMSKEARFASLPHRCFVLLSDRVGAADGKGMQLGSCRACIITGSLHPPWTSEPPTSFLTIPTTTHHHTPPP